MKKKESRYDWVRCTVCHKLTAFWMSDSYNLWCTHCKKIVE